MTKNRYDIRLVERRIDRLYGVIELADDPLEECELMIQINDLKDYVTMLKHEDE